MLTLKQLEKANKVLAEIKTLDKEINEIDKQGYVMAQIEHGETITLSLAYEKQPLLETKKLQFDEDGSIEKRTEYYPPNPFSIDMSSMMKAMQELRSPKYSIDSKERFSSEISPETTLVIISAIYNDKVAKRERLIKKIEAMGFQLS